MKTLITYLIFNSLFCALISGISIAKELNQTQPTVLNQELPKASQGDFLKVMSGKVVGENYSFDDYSDRKLRNILVISGWLPEVRAKAYLNERCGARAYQAFTVKKKDTTFSIFYNCDKRCYGVASKDKYISPRTELDQKICEGLWDYKTTYMDVDGL